MSDLAKVGAVVIIVLGLFFGVAQLVRGQSSRLNTYFVFVLFETGSGLRPGMALKSGSYDVGFVDCIYPLQLTQLGLECLKHTNRAPSEPDLTFIKMLKRFPTPQEWDYIKQYWPPTATTVSSMQQAIAAPSAELLIPLPANDVPKLYTEAKIRIRKWIHGAGHIKFTNTLYADAKFTIGQEGLIGEKTLSVDSGSSMPIIDSAEVERGFIYASGTSEDYVTAAFGKVTDSLTSGLFGTSGSLGGTLGDFTGKLNASLDGINQLVSDASGLITTNQGSIATTLKNVQSMSVNFLELSKNLNIASVSIKDLATDPKYADTIKGMTDNLTSVSASLNHLTTELDSLVSDPQVQQDAKDSVRLTKETLEEAKKTLERFQQTLDKADGVLDSAGGLMDDASRAIKDVQGKVDQLSSIGSNVDVKMGMQVRAVDKNRDHNLNSDDSYVGDLNMAVGYQDTYLSLGADNIGQDNNWNFLLGWGDLNGFSVRGGVYRGEMGVGAQYNLPQGGGVDVMLYDTEDPKLNAYGRIPVGDSVDVVLGVEDVENDPQATVGIGVKLK